MVNLGFRGWPLSYLDCPTEMLSTGISCSSARSWIPIKKSPVISSGSKPSRGNRVWGEEADGCGAVAEKAPTQHPRAKTAQKVVWDTVIPPQDETGDMTNPARGLPSTTEIGRVALCVTGLDRMVEFYRDVVGLAVQHRESNRATLASGGEPLLSLRVDPEAPERGRDETGLFHTAFLVPSREALGEALGRIRNRWRLDGASDHLVSEALYLSDPEGNGIEIYRDRPREEWPTNPDGTVGMDTRRLDVDELGDRCSGDDRLPDGTVVGHIHLEVSSLADAQDFYVDTLGMNIRQRYGDSALFVAAGDYHHHIGLNVWNGRTEPAQGRGLEWFEVVVPDQESLAGVRNRFDEREIDVSETDDCIAVADPDGIQLRIRAEG